MRRSKTLCLAGLLGLAFAAASRAQDSDQSSLFNYSFPAAEPRILLPDVLGHCLAAATRAIAPTFFLDRRILGHATFDDFVDYLSAQANRAYDFETGHEGELRKWILSQAQNSVNPLSLYQQSLLINKGNIFGAVLTIHQLLRNEARYFDSRRYRYSSSAEEYHRFFDQFIDLRGDLVERGPGYNGDHAGTWYRMWGMMLYRLMWEREVRSFSEEGSALKEKVAGQVGSWMGKTLGTYVEMSKLPFVKETDVRGKISINTLSLRTADVLLKDLWSESRSVPDAQVLSACQKQSYLKIVKEQPAAELPAEVRRMFAPVNLEEEFGPTHDQSGGTCYAQAFAGVTEAALFRADGQVRDISPEHALVTTLLNTPPEKARLLRMLVGVDYAESSETLGSSRDLFPTMGHEFFAGGKYVETPRFRKLYDKAHQTLRHESFEEVLFGELTSDPFVMKIYALLEKAAQEHEIREPKLNSLRFKYVYTRSKRRAPQAEARVFYGTLKKVLDAKIPPIAAFVFDTKRLQISHDGGRSWTPIPQSLLHLPTQHAALVESVEEHRGELYLVFRNSFDDGTDEIPHRSKLRMRLREAYSMVTDLMIVAGPWDAI